MPLTDTAIRNAKPGEKIIKLSDGGGLQLWVMPTGSKLWNVAYRDLEHFPTKWIPVGGKKRMRKQEE